MPTYLKLGFVCVMGRDKKKHFFLLSLALCKMRVPKATGNANQEEILICKGRVRQMVLPYIERDDVVAVDPLIRRL